jgi:uroporphyrinogen-III synthase
MRVLVTRPQEDFARTAEALRKRGHQPVAAPLFVVRGLTGIVPTAADAVLATSANAVRMADAAGLQALSRVPFLAVGAQTAVAARAAGFTDVRSADGDGAALAVLVRHAVPAGATVVQLAGRPRRDEAIAALGASYRLLVIETYETVAMEDLPDGAMVALRADEVDAVLHLSPRATAVFADLATRAGLLGQAQRLLHVVISPAAADARLPRTRIAQHPTLESVIDAL